MQTLPRAGTRSPPCSPGTRAPRWPPAAAALRSGAHGTFTSVGVAQGGRLGGLGLLPLDSHHDLLLHALPARRARLHLLVRRQGQRRVVLVLEAFVGQGGLERRGVHGGGGARAGRGERGGAGCGRRRSGLGALQRLPMAIERGVRARGRLLLLAPPPGCPSAALARPALRQAGYTALPCATPRAGCGLQGPCSWGQGREGRGWAGRPPPAALPFSLPSFSPRLAGGEAPGDAPRSCPCSLTGKVCARLGNRDRLLSRKKRSLSFLTGPQDSQMPRPPLSWRHGGDQPCRWGLPG